MGSIGAHGGVTVDPEAPGMQGAIAAHAGARPVACLVTGWRGPCSTANEAPGWAMASVPFRALPTSRAVARRAGPLASSLSLRAENRRMCRERDRDASRASGARSSAPQGVGQALLEHPPLRLRARRHSSRRGGGSPAAGVPGCPGRCLPMVHRERLERSRAALATRQGVA